MTQRPDLLEKRERGIKASPSGRYARRWDHIKPVPKVDAAPMLAALIKVAEPAKQPQQTRTLCLGEFVCKHNGWRVKAYVTERFDP